MFQNHIRSNMTNIRNLSVGHGGRWERTFRDQQQLGGTARIRRRKRDYFDFDDFHMMEKMVQGEPRDRFDRSARKPDRTRNELRSCSGKMGGDLQGGSGRRGERPNSTAASTLAARFPPPPPPFRPAPPPRFYARLSWIFFLSSRRNSRVQLYTGCAYRF